MSYYRDTASYMSVPGRPHPEGTVGWTKPTYRHWPQGPGACEDCDGEGYLLLDNSEQVTGGDCAACWTCDGTGVIA